MGMEKLLQAPAEGTGNGNGINETSADFSRRRIRDPKPSSRIKHPYLELSQTMLPLCSMDQLMYAKIKCYDHEYIQYHTHEVRILISNTELPSYERKLEYWHIKKEKEYAVLWNNWYTKCEECKYDKISYDKAYNDMQQKIRTCLQLSFGESQGVNNTAKTISPQPASVHYKSKSSCFSNNFEKLEENHRNSLIPKTQKHKSSECNNIKLAIRNAKSKVVCAIANVSKHENQKKHKANVRKSKELGSKGSLASSRPSKPEKLSLVGSKLEEFLPDVMEN
ncbi:hypothetical protein Tco_0218952 [Tanacetum coccineum]